MSCLPYVLDRPITFWVGLLGRLITMDSWSGRVYALCVRLKEGMGVLFYLRPPMLLPPPPPKLPPPPPKLLLLPLPPPKLLLPLLPPLPKDERVVVERVDVVVERVEGVVRVEEFLCVLPELLRRVLVLGVNVLSRETLPRCTLPRVVVPLCPKLRD